jgi:hypothetical protein
LKVPYTATSRLQDMIVPDACGDAVRSMADAGLDAFQANVRRNTPIDTNPYRDRPGRPRGALRASIERTPVERGRSALGTGWGGRVFTEDPIAPFVEWDTAAHMIFPRTPGGTLHWRDRATGEDRFSRGVRHPGTKGQHMFSIGAAITEHELHAIFRPALDVWEKAVTGRGFRVIDRRTR